MGRMLLAVVAATVVTVCAASRAQAQQLDAGSGLDASSQSVETQGTVGQARATVTGVVVDSTGQRIVGAAVVIELASGQRLEASSDVRGEFRFPDVDPGAHRVTAASVGFAAASARIEVDARGSGHVTLVLPVEGITSQITVTAPTPHRYDAPRAAAATRLNVPIIDTPVSVQVVPRQLMEDQAVRGLEDIYTNVSGVTQSGNTLNAQTEIRPMVRGFETAVPLRNGLRATTVGAVDPVNIESVEVLKGPASILYGALEPGGVVNYVTKKPLMAPRYEVTQQAGSFRFLRTTADATGPLNAARTVAYRFNAAFEDADSFRASLSQRRVAVVPSLTFRPSEGTELFTDFSFSRETLPYDSGVPFGFDGKPLVDPSTFFGNPDLRGRELDDYFTSVGFFQRLHPRATLRTQFQFHRVHALNESIRHRGLGGQPGAELLRRRYQNEDRTDDDYQFVADVLSSFSLGTTRHDGLFGFDLAYQDSDFRRFRTNIPDIPVTGNSRDFVPPAVQPQEVVLGTNRWLAVYVQDQIAATTNGRLKLLVGARYDTSLGEGTRDGEAQASIENDSLTGRFGAGYTLTPGLLVYASVAQSFVPQQPGTVDIDGNLLDPQTGLQYEAGVKSELAGGRFLSTVSVYRIRKANVPLTDLPLFNQTGRIVFFPGVAERSRGIEFDAAGRVTDRLSVVGNYAFNDAETVQHVNMPSLVGTRLGNTPAHLSRVWVAYDSSAGIARGFGIGGGFRAQSSQTMQFDTLALDGFTVAELGAWYRLPLAAAQRLRLQVNVDNLFDREYYVRASDRSIVHPGTQRSARLTLAIEF
jgi:iron complex outermembrane recepter protein